MRLLSLILIILMMPLMAAPAQAAVSNCTEEEKSISWYEGSMAGTATATVYWTACNTDDGRVRNNAKWVRFKVNAGNCSAVYQVGFNVSSIEGYDLGKKWVPCEEGIVASKLFGIETAGFTYSKVNWYVEGAYDWQPFFLLCTCWSKHGPTTWGGK